MDINRMLNLIILGAGGILVLTLCTWLSAVALFGTLR